MKPTKAKLVKNHDPPSPRFKRRWVVFSFEHVCGEPGGRPEWLFMIYPTLSAVRLVAREYVQEGVPFRVFELSGD